MALAKSSSPPLSVNNGAPSRYREFCRHLSLPPLVANVSELTFTHITIVDILSHLQADRTWVCFYTYVFAARPPRAIVCSPSLSLCLSFCGGCCSICNLLGSHPLSYCGVQAVAVSPFSEVSWAACRQNFQVLDGLCHCSWRCTRNSPPFACAVW